MREIQLTKGQKAIVDDEDYAYLSQFKWQANYSKGSQTFYASRGQKIDGKQKTFQMHREILCAPKGLYVDHQNHNGLDNRKENIRVVTCCQNHQNRRMRKDNTTGTGGVMWRKDRKRWRVRIRIMGKEVYAGLFVDLDDAIMARERIYENYGFHPNHGKSF